MNLKAKIFWLHIANALIAGGLVFLGGLGAGKVTLETLGFSLAAGAIVALVQCRDYFNELLGHVAVPSTIQLFRFI